jgi:Tfp pilus assembly protein PilF
MRPPTKDAFYAALERNDYAAAMQIAQQAIALDADEPIGYLLYGDVFLAMENGKKALEQYEKAHALRPDEADIFFKIGMAYETQGDPPSALAQYQTAYRLAPSSHLYLAYYGRLLHNKGIEAGNINYANEGLALMEQAYQAGERDAALEEQLAIAHLHKSTESWRTHPEQAELVVPTEQAHVEQAKARLNAARQLHNPANQALAQRIAELDEAVRMGEKRIFAGYPYLRKAPLITGAILLVIGQVFLGVSLLILGGLYHLSQYKPGYLCNQMLFQDEYRPPFVVRRLNKIDEMLSSIVFWDTSYTGLLFKKFVFNLLVHALRYSVVIIALPYEIAKGLAVNYGLKERLRERLRG